MPSGKMDFFYKNAIRGVTIALALVMPVAVAIAIVAVAIVGVMTIAVAIVTDPLRHRRKYRDIQL